MQETTNYGLKKPASDEFYDIEIINQNMDLIDELLKQAAESGGNPEELTNHIANKENPHEVTKAQVGLGNVPNVKTNDQTPTYAVPSEVAELTSGEKMSVAMGKIAKALASAIYVVSFDEGTGTLVTKSIDYEG